MGLKEPRCLDGGLGCQGARPEEDEEEGVKRRGVPCRQCNGEADCWQGEQAEPEDGVRFVRRPAPFARAFSVRQLRAATGARAPGVALTSASTSTSLLSWMEGCCL